MSAINFIAINRNPHILTYVYEAELNWCSTHDNQGQEVREAEILLLEIKAPGQAEETVDWIMETLLGMIH